MIEQQTEQGLVDRNYQWFVVERHPQAISGNGWNCYYDKDMDRDGAATASGSCSSGPTRCAIGCDLPEDTLRQLYLESYSPSAILDVLNRCSPISARYENCRPLFLKDIQRVHDNANASYFRTSFMKRLRQLCKKYGLVYPGARKVSK